MLVTLHEASHCAVHEGWHRGNISPGHWAGGGGLGGQGPLVSEMALLGQWWPGPGWGRCLSKAWASGTAVGDVNRQWKAVYRTRTPLSVQGAQAPSRE